jgi:hypothetical protein
MVMRGIALAMTEMRQTILSAVTKMSRRIYPRVNNLQVSRLLSIEMHVKRKMGCQDMDTKLKMKCIMKKVSNL